MVGYRPWGCKRVGHDLTTKQDSGATPGIYLQPHCIAGFFPSWGSLESVNSESVLIRSKLKVKVAQTCPTLCNPMDYSLQGSFVHGILQAGILKWVDFPFSRGSSQPRDQTQVLSHCRQILYCLNHQRSPRILEWVPYPFFRGSSQPKNWTRVSCTAGSFFTS